MKKWETVAWITLEAIAVTAIVGTVMLLMVAVSVLLT